MDNNQPEQAQEKLTQYLAQHWQLTCTSWYQDEPTVLKSIFEALPITPGDHFILSPLAHQVCIDTLLGLGAKLIFIDLSEKDGQLDVDILEHFLSLSSILNERNELLYRKDDSPIRGILLTQFADHFGAVEALQFISHRYHLPIVEDFSEALSLVNNKGQYSGTLGALNFARIPQGISSEAGILVNIPPSGPKLNLSGFEAPDPGAKFLQIAPPTSSPSNPKTLLSQLTKISERWEDQGKITHQITKILGSLDILQRWNPYSKYAPIFLAEQGASLREVLQEHYLERGPDWFTQRKAILSKNLYLQPRKIFWPFLDAGIGFSTKKIKKTSLESLREDIKRFYQSVQK